ncbi:MAG: FUSC family membrane protein, partial [Myxococcaceae bacterium]
MAIPQPVKEFIRLAPVRPDLPAGVRAGVVAVCPLLVASLLPAPMISWLSLGGFQAVLQDRGGAYQDRAWAMARVTLLGGVSCFIGTLAGMAPLATLPLAFLLVFACGLGQASGPGTASAGIAVAVTFFVASGMPSADPLVAVANTGARMSGGLLAMLLTLVFWPVRVYRPARLAIARCYDTLGALAASLAAGDQGSPDQHSERASIREALENARRVLTGTRRGRQTESERGARLVILLENAEQLLGTCIALEGALARAAPEEKARVTGALGVMASSTREIALRLRTEDPVPGEVPRLTQPPGNGATQVMLGRLQRDIEAASEAAEGLALGRPLALAGRVPPL